VAGRALSAARGRDRPLCARPCRTGTTTISATLTFGGAATEKAMASAMSVAVRGRGSVRMRDKDARVSSSRMPAPSSVVVTPGSIRGCLQSLVGELSPSEQALSLLGSLAADAAHSDEAADNAAHT
jgi:hypothetical protein